MTAASSSRLVGCKPEPRLNIITLVRDILGNRSLTGNERALGVQLALGAGIDGLYYGSVKTMAQKMGWSKPTAERALAGLVRGQICQREIRALGPHGGTHSAMTIFRWSARWRDADRRDAEAQTSPKPASSTSSIDAVNGEPNPSGLMESLISSEKTTSLEAIDPCSGIVAKPSEAPPLAWPEAERRYSPQPAALLSKLFQSKFPAVEFDQAAIRIILHNLHAKSIDPTVFVERLARKRESGYQPLSWVAFAIAFSRAPVLYEYREAPTAGGSLYTQIYRKYDPSEDE